MKKLSVGAMLNLLALGAAVALAVGIAVGIALDFRQASEHARARQRLLSSAMVASSSAKIASVRQMLEQLARRPILRQMDGTHCDPVLQDLYGLTPGTANIGYTDLQGTLLCSALPAAKDRPLTPANLPWFQQFMVERSFRVGTPFMSPLTQKMGVAVSLPIMNAGQAMVGGVHILMNLDALKPDVPMLDLSTGTRLGLLSREGIFLWRSADPEEVTGVRASPTDGPRLVDTPDGQLERQGLDGVQRLYVMASVPETGWVAFVGVPTSDIYSRVRARAYAAIASALVIVLGLFALARWMTGRMTRPLASLSGTARAVRQGDFEAQVAEEGPSEIVEVAREINRTLQVRREALRPLLLADIAFEFAPSLFIMDANLVILRVNPAFTRTTGYTAEQALGQTPQLLRSSRHDAAFYQSIWETITHKGGWEGELWTRRSNGDMFAALVTIIAARSQGGEVTHYVSGHVDISAQKLSERTLVQARNAADLAGQTMKNQRQLLDMVIEHLPFGVVVYDQEHNLILNNSEFTRLLKLPPELCRPAVSTFADIVQYNVTRGDHPGLTYERVLKRFVDMMEAAQPVRFERQQRDGTWLEIQGTPLSGGWTLLTYTDITARKQAS